MEEQKAGAQIGKKAFIQSLLILLGLMILAGLLTIFVPSGRYDRALLDGREVIQADSFHYIEKPDYPVWRWFTAPLEVLWRSDNSLTIIVITVFLLMIGSAFAVLDKCGILMAALNRIVKRFGSQKYKLLLIISFFFMLMGALFGIFEETITLIPIMLALSYFLGWDSLVGLGMSILATNLGFSAAISNPFTIGIAQEIAGLPPFSGAWLRVIIFMVIYAIFALFITRYAKKIEKDPTASPVYEEDKKQREKYSHIDLENEMHNNPKLGRGMRWFLVFLVLILTVLIGGPFIPAIADYTLPIVGLLFLFGGVGAGLVSGAGGKTVLQAVKEGLGGIAPGIPLILMAASIKYIADSGGIMDTILFKAAGSFSSASPFLGAALIYVLALFIEFFIGSASAKAFLLMPILFPLADLMEVTRQVAVTAYCFGDGFSNLAYPTNPVLLIALGLTVVSYPKWMKWTLKLWFWVLLATFLFLAFGVAIHYGPF